MDDILIRIGPAAEGWSVECPNGLQPLLFFSGSKAEAQAHALAQGVARSGADARVLVHDRRDQVVGSTRYFARTALDV